MRMSLATSIAAVAAAAGLFGLSAASASNAATRPHPQHSDGHSRSLTVVEHAITDTEVDTGTTGDSLGDLLAFGNPVFNSADNTKIGSDQGSCIRTKVGVSWECSWTTTLKNGSLVVEGPFFDAGDSTLAVTGGTGVWKSARGQMRLHARDAAGTSYDFTFSITGAR